MLILESALALLPAAAATAAPIVDGLGGAHRSLPLHYSLSMTVHEVAVKGDVWFWLGESSPDGVIPCELDIATADASIRYHIYCDTLVERLPGGTSRFTVGAVEPTGRGTSAKPWASATVTVVYDPSTRALLYTDHSGSVGGVVTSFKAVER